MTPFPRTEKAGALAAAALLPSLATSLVLPTPLASTHHVLYGRYSSRAASSGTVLPQRSGSTTLSGPGNVMSMEYQTSDSSYADLVNLTGPLLDSEGHFEGIEGPSSSSFVDLVDTESFVAGMSNENYAQDTDFEAEKIKKLRPLEGWSPSPLLEADQEVIEDPSSSALPTGIDGTPLADEYPSVSKIVKFALPAIGVWLCSPVLSMIDTASVGLLAGTAQQAALNPAVSVTDYGALLVAFMYTATTNLVASAQEKDLADDTAVAVNKDSRGAQRRTKSTMLTALKLALVVGISFGSVLFGAAPTLLRAIIGNPNVDPQVFGAALRYVRIRSLGMPAAVVIGTAQSGCLGMKDVKSPLLVLAAAAAINLLADIILVRNAHPWLGGAAGAAWATVLSQYGALFMFMKWLTNKSSHGIDTKSSGGASALGKTMMEAPRRVGRSIRARLPKPSFLLGRLEKSSGVDEPKPSASAAAKPSNENGAFARGFLSSHKPSSILNPLRLTKEAASKFAPFVVPVTTTSIGRVSGYVTMSHVASSAFGTIDMAAHQIAVSIFCCLAPVVDALNQVAQSFVPGIFSREKGRRRADALKKTSVNFAKVGALFGSAIVALVVAGIPPLSRFFTTDREVLRRVRNAIPGIAVFLGFDGLMCIGEGTLLGQQDLTFLRNMYAGFFFIVPAFMLRLKRRALNGVPVGIGTMWGTFSAYEVARTVLWLGRMVYLQRKVDREADELEASAAIAASN
ncbi:hypothetical protein THAOC_10405 [Thalassiosira oceanica]|uniref:Uncharacterized protein n=2 Tax=Thalassiosira oceanica TaxID=159749 RepID=K0STW1_THAOC|nr:hypothetical protein THAOC_10405 [Thalassiosira oceanica]|mmetsp:Transcript_27069/g.64259  ORF Transcript_27069/g.64259 Transcript_27069/m.64259 type:complete len:739 (-) Transcript_27069:136-2352(-)|eukprot:EJK68424.1 hypothetical protein THAOC_10405 [Thalassiosira oceanica]